MSTSRSFPADIVQRICEIVYLDSVPLCSLRLLDPPTIPSAAFDGQNVSTSIYETQRVLYVLCLVNQTFYRYAKPLISRRIQFTLPYRFMLLVDDALASRQATLSNIRLMDFSSFRATGLGRTVGESTERRFVTPERLYTLIHASAGLVAFGSSETMDSALSLQVLEALLLRDGGPSRPSRVRDVSTERGIGPVHNALQSLDLCGCISPRFLEAMRAFVRKHLESVPTNRPMYDLLEEEDDDNDDGLNVERRGRSRFIAHPKHTSRDMSSQVRTRTFPSMQRLGLKGVSLPRDLLAPFLLAFPNLRLLDLSETRVDAPILDALGQSTIRLESLSLSRCRAITSESLVKLLVHSPTTFHLTELAIQGTLLFPTPVSPEDLSFIISNAPCMRSGALRYLDLGGCALTNESLSLVPPQHALLDLGLGAIPDITLGAVCSFLLRTAPNVQILDLSHSCTAHGPVHAVHLYHDLLAPCTQRPPALEIAEQLRALGIKKDNSEPWHPPTNLRVLELGSAALGTIRGGVGSWKVIWGAGRRGWVVDTVAGPHPQAFDIPLQDQDSDDVDRGRDRTMKQPMDLRRSGSQLGRTVSGISPGEEQQHNRSTRRINRTLSNAPHMPTMITASSRPFESRSRSLSLSTSREPPRARTTRSSGMEPPKVQFQVLRNLPADHPRHKVLDYLSSQGGSVQGFIGWHSHKMEVLLGYGLLGREIGTYAWFAYQAS